MQGGYGCYTTSERKAQRPAFITKSRMGGKQLCRGPPEVNLAPCAIHSPCTHPQERKATDSCYLAQQSAVTNTQGLDYSPQPSFPCQLWCKQMCCGASKCNSSLQGSSTPHSSVTQRLLPLGRGQPTSCTSWQSSALDQSCMCVFQLTSKLIKMK